MQKIAPRVNQRPRLVSLKDSTWAHRLSSTAKGSQIRFQSKTLAELSTLETKKQRKGGNPVQMYIFMIFNAQQQSCSFSRHGNRPTKHVKAI